MSRLMQDGNTDPITEGHVIRDSDHKFSPYNAAFAVVNHYGMITTKGLSPNDPCTYWIYNPKKGIYQPDGADEISETMNKLAGDKFTIHLKREMFEKIKYMSLGKIEDFDADPYLLCVRNGVIDLRTGIRFEHSPKFKQTIYLDVKYDASAKCPKIDAFLHDIAEDPSDVETMYDIIASMCIKVPFDAYIALLGEGSNGKGRLLMLIDHFIGQHNLANTRLEKLGQRFQASELYRKLAFITTEAEGSKTAFNWLKMIVVGDYVTDEIKYGPHIGFNPFCKVLFDTNNPPKFNDNTYGAIRRTIKLDFPYKFVDNPKESWEKKRNPNILDEITTNEELSGLLNVVIERAPELIKTAAIRTRKSHEQMAAEYDIQSHSIASFVDMCCVLEDRDPKSDLYLYSVSSAEFNESYAKFCKLYNVTPQNPRSVKKYLTEECNAKYGQFGEDRSRGYRYIKVRPEKEWPCRDMMQRSTPQGEPATA